MKSFYVRVEMQVLVHDVRDEREARTHAMSIIQDFINKVKRLRTLSDVSEIRVISTTTLSGDQT